MTCLLSTSNRLRGGNVLAAAGGALPTAQGYLAADVIDGQVERCWRRGGAVRRHQIMVQLAAAVPVDLVAAFDLRPIGTTTVGVTGVEVYTSAGDKDGPFAKIGSLAMNARGDGALRTPGATARTIYLDVLLSGDADLIFGEFWAGSAVAFPVAPVQLDRDPLRNNASRESPGGTTWATKRAERREVFGLPLPPLTDGEDAAASAILDALEGSLRPVVLVPDASAIASVYHGRLSDADPRSFGLDRYWDGRALSFTESGRVLRG